MTATEVTPYKITHRHSLQLSGTPFLTLESSLSQCQEGPSPPVLLHIENLEGYFAVLHKNTRRLARRKKHAASTAYIIGLAAWYKCNLKATGFFTLPPLPNTESPSMSSHPYHHWQPYVKLNPCFGLVTNQLQFRSKACPSPSLPAILSFRRLVVGRNPCASMV